jgi:type I restriction enzyme S subunit
MTNLDQLIAEFCPDGVEYKPLGEIAEFKYGYTDKAKSQGNARFVRITDINERGKLRQGDEKFVDVDETNDCLLKCGDLLVARTGATFGKQYEYYRDKLLTFEEKSA